MGEYRLESRLDVLRHAQNPDGGWGYFPGKQSWLEPTVWAALALHGEAAADRAWALLESWQLANGGWRPSGDVQVAGWGTALCVTLAISRGETGESVRKGVTWLLESAGVESNLMSRAINSAAAKVGLPKSERDLSLKGWPWKPGTAAWVEPTAHALVALKRLPSELASGVVRDRIQEGEAQLMNVRCRDGGWNYGSPAVLGGDLPSYPETTALALIGLQGHAGLSQSLELAARMAKETTSPMAQAWLAIALRLHGVEAHPVVAPSRDLAITALAALAENGGANIKFLSTGGDRSK